MGYKSKAVKIEIMRLNCSSCNHVKLLDDFKVYPNPVNDYLNIDIGLENSIFNIYTIDGKLVYKGNDNIIDVRNLDKGVYILHINNNNVFKSLKFIKN